MQLPIWHHDLQRHCRRAVCTATWGRAGQHMRAGLLQPPCCCRSCCWCFWRSLAAGAAAAAAGNRPAHVLPVFAASTSDPSAACSTAVQLGQSMPTHPSSHPMQSRVPPQRDGGKGGPTRRHPPVLAASTSEPSAARSTAVQSSGMSMQTTPMGLMLRVSYSTMISSWRGHANGHTHVVEKEANGRQAGRRAYGAHAAGVVLND